MSTGMEADGAQVEESCDHVFQLHRPNAVSSGMSPPRPLGNLFCCSMGSAKEDVLPLEAVREFGGDAGAEVRLNVYWLQDVRFDEHGRVERSMGGHSGLSWHGKMFRDVVGIYHLGVEVHGSEYTFGNYHAVKPRRLGGLTSGVCSHKPRSAGPQCVFKCSVDLGHTLTSSVEVEVWAAFAGASCFGMDAYDKIRNNCVDFAACLCSSLGVEAPPPWCQRATVVARHLLGGTYLGGASKPAQVEELTACGEDACQQSVVPEGQ
uniref:PPPDE domain-containing protein n=1 Tax=Alexandrium monilatum TaxID=311494 RepID=A0A7S4Q734_9DINO|mmetsp:Transcript_89915/g.278028  ORF Transcript_89915/g.278028 Transcript_89915/m.278028 type:complete len:263 (-) Transcript_89915:96-884(-)